MIFSLMVGCGQSNEVIDDRSSDGKSTSTPFPLYGNSIPTLIPRPNLEMPIAITVDSESNSSFTRVCFNIRTEVQDIPDELLDLSNTQYEETLFPQLKAVFSGLDISLILEEEDCQAFFEIDGNLENFKATYTSGSQQMVCTTGYDYQGEFRLVSGSSQLIYPFHIHQDKLDSIDLNRCDRYGLDLEKFWNSEIPNALAEWWGSEAYLFCQEYTNSLQGVCDIKFRELSVEEMLAAISQMYAYSNYYRSRLLAVNYLDWIWEKYPEHIQDIVPLLIDVLYFDEDGLVRQRAGEILKKNSGEDFPGPRHRQWRLNTDGTIDWEWYDIQDPNAWQAWWEGQQ